MAACPPSPGQRSPWAPHSTPLSSHPQPSPRQHLAPDGIVQRDTVSGSLHGGGGGMSRSLQWFDSRLCESCRNPSPLGLERGPSQGTLTAAPFPLARCGSAAAVTPCTGKYSPPLQHSQLGLKVHQIAASASPPISCPLGKEREGSPPVFSQVALPGAATCCDPLWQRELSLRAAGGGMVVAVAVTVAVAVAVTGTRPAA